jgi:7,8-dihydropterin-6-yl-methyl-4-(beta-D-ribofuranosyl)aminobenzene 5'-phosphate synthase
VYEAQHLTRRTAPQAASLNLENLKEEGQGGWAVRITCVVDDAVQRSSPLWGEHGVAFLIESPAGRLLFDTGQSGTVLLHNLELLDVAPETIDAPAISHAHYDHTGGLSALLDKIRPGTPLYANPDLFRERYSQREGKLESMGLSTSQKTLAAHFALSLDAAPQEILPGVWTTGEIAERPDPHGSSDYHLMREGESLVADEYRDDLALAVQAGERLVLLCGCCHAGLLNTLSHVERSFEHPISVIAGGLHLSSASPDELLRTANLLSVRPALQHVYPNHCSGEAAFVILTQILRTGVVRPCPAGTILTF